MNKVKDNLGREYLQTNNGTCFNSETNEKVINIIDNLLHSNKRIRVWYGENGKSWNEENDICGSIGRSTGTFKIPLLIHSSRSYGGGALLTHCIIKIVDTQTKRVLYVHPNFTQPLFTVTDSDIQDYQANVLSDGQIYGRCKTVTSAKRLAAFMNGERMSK